MSAACLDYLGLRGKTDVASMKTAILTTGAATDLACMRSNQSSSQALLKKLQDKKDRVDANFPSNNQIEKPDLSKCQKNHGQLCSQLITYKWQRGKYNDDVCDEVRHGKSVEQHDCIHAMLALFIGNDPVG